MPRAAALLLALLLLAPGAARAEAVPAHAGTADPVVSFGLAGVSDWGTATPFLDIARLGRSWSGVRADGAPGLDTAALRAAGALDARGWPRRLPAGHAALRTLWDWRGAPAAAPGRGGRYVIAHEGAGRLALGGAARVLERAPGRIVFETPGDGLFWLDVAPGAGGGDLLRALTILRADHVALHAAGALFDPDWTARIADAREIRFMDWMATNGSEVARWADRARPGDAVWTTPAGVPPEVMVRLANEIGADPWFTLPHRAGDGYVRAFAALLRDRLDPRLKAHLEFSNEVWNPGFAQHGWAREAAAARWGRPEAVADWHARRATEVARLADAVFGAEAQTRLVHVLATHPGWPDYTRRQLAAAAWRAAEPAAFDPPAAVFDELAVTTYFGGAEVAEPDRRARLLAAIADPATDAAAALTAALADPGHPGAIPELARRLAAFRALAAAHGLRLVAYEGGQHVHHGWGVADLGETEAATLTRFMSDYTASAAMAGLYARLWEVWAEIGAGPFMQYGDVAWPTRWGSFAPWRHPGDRNPRADFLAARAAAGGSWWGEGGGAQYGHGVLRRAGAGGARLLGTDAEDYLLGGPGDDRLVPGAGADGLSGGAGTDTLVLPGRAADYRLAPEGAGHRLTGPAGPKFLLGIERVAIGGAPPRPLADLAAPGR